jgi:hypothetical protein
MANNQNTLNVSFRKQLFIDHRFFDRADKMSLCMNPPYQPPEPVLQADRPWEEQGIGGYNTVIREDKNRFRLWYAAQMKSGLPQEGAVRLCYAESEDGITWHKPDLGLVSFRGSTANNIVAPLDERQSMQGATIYLDKRAPKEARYRLWSKYQPRDDEIKAGIRPGLWAMYSPDGLHWTYDEDQPNPIKCATPKTSSSGTIALTCMWVTHASMKPSAETKPLKCNTASDIDLSAESHRPIFAPGPNPRSLCSKAMPLTSQHPYLLIP